MTTMTACSALDDFTAPAVPVDATQPALPSPTTVWFPPSATPTPQFFVTRTATAIMNPGLGAVTLHDNFSLANVWNTAASDAGSATIDRNRLTFAVQPGAYMVSLRKEIILSNFYAEITASPNLCKDNDEYGMVIRANAVAYYRFALTCNGEAHAERISVYEKHILHGNIPSRDIPIGAPSEVRISVWALGSEMRLFLNDRYQFSITDLNYASGTLGVFASSVTDTPVTVSFSDLTIHELTIAPPTKTPIP